ncbi:MAG: hypothetical protein ACI86P_001998 [Flavobacteriales bacterium]|jgi:hypothetical protein
MAIIEFIPKAGMLPQYNAHIFNWEVFHAQHVVRLNNKDGKAYFAVTNDKPRSGFLTIMKTNARVLHADDDLIYPVGESAGRFVWHEVYTPNNPIGNWNHPGKMAVLDGVLIVAAQNWQDFYPGKSEDSLVWYDISDPVQPKFMAKWTKTEMGIPDGEVATVDLVKTMDVKYLVTAGGDHHYVIFKADLVSTKLADWTKFSDGWFSGQHGSCIRSAQEIVKDGASDYYFDAFREDEVFPFNKFDNNGAKVGATNYPNSLPGADRDWATSSIYVSEKRVPVVYSVKSGAEWNSFRIYQAHL